MSDDALAHLTGFKRLSELTLGGTPITDEGLIHLGKIPSLWYLVLHHCPNITGSGLEHLAALPRLRKLALDGTPITDDATIHLQKMKSLRILHITHTKITANGAAKLQAALPDCVVFHESLANVPWQPAMAAPVPAVVAPEPASEMK